MGKERIMIMTEAQKSEADKLREQAAAADQRAQESFDRCDTDGFLSQWASGIIADKLRLQANVTEAGGKWTFPALFDLEGNRLPAKIIRVPDRFRGYGKREVWAFLKPDWSFTGVFVGRLTEKNMRKRGYVEAEESAPARAEIVGEGHGLSGSAWATIVRTDRGCPAEVVEGAGKGL